MVRWDADADRMLLIAVIQGTPVHLGPDTVERVSQAYPVDPESNDRPTPKAITERIGRIKSMFKKYGTAEPRRAKKKMESIEIGDGEGTPKVRKVRTPKVSTDKITKAKPKATKGKRSKSKVSDDGSDDEDFRPKSKISREAQALMKENPDFSRYGKEATPSRRRNKKAVKYSEEDIKGEPQSEDEPIAGSTPIHVSVDPAPKATLPPPIDTAAAQAYSSQGSSNAVSHADYQQISSSPYTGSIGYASSAPIYSPIASAYPSAYITSPPQSMNEYGTPINAYPTPNSSFSSSDFGSIDVASYPSLRHDSIISDQTFGGWNHAVHGSMQTLQSPGMTYHDQGFGGMSSTMPRQTQMSVGSPFARPRTRPSGNNTHSQLGGLRRAATFHGSLPSSMPMTPITPHTTFPAQGLTPDPSPEYDMESRKQGLGIELESPFPQRSMPADGLDTMLSGHMDPTYVDHFDSSGFDMNNTTGLDGLNFDADVF